LLPAAACHPRHVSGEAHDARRSHTYQHRHLARNDPPVPRRKRQRKHHVHHHQSPARPQYPEGLSRRQLLSVITKVMERIARGDNVNAGIGQRNPPHVCENELEAVDGRGRSGNPPQHLLRNIEADNPRAPVGCCEGHQPSAAPQVE